MRYLLTIAGLLAAGAERLSDVGGKGVHVRILGVTGKGVPGSLTDENAGREQPGVAESGGQGE